MPTEPTTASLPSPRPPSPRLLIALFLLATLPRLALALIYLNLPIGLDDMYQYDMLGRSLAAGRGYRWYARADVAALRPYLDVWYKIDIPTSQVPEDGYLTTFRAPGYPFFLAAIYLLVGTAGRLQVVRLLQVFLGAALAPLTALLASRLHLPAKSSTLAGAVVALYPILWMYPLGLGSENLFFPLSLASGLMLFDAARSGRPKHAALAGLLLGAATLTRGAFAVTLPLALIWLARRARWRRAALAGGVALAVVAPWSLRNSLVLGRPAFVETTVGYNLFIGYHPEGDGGFVTRIALLPVHLLDDGERDRWTMDQALGFIRADPGRAASLALNRLAYFWGWETRELVYFYSNDAFGPMPPASLLAAMALLAAPWILVALLAPFGLAVAPDSDGRRLTLTFVGGSLLAYIPILAEPRFHLPLVPWLAAYAAFALQDPGRWLRPPYRRRLAVAAAALFVLVLLALWGWDAVRLLPRWQQVFAAGGNRLYLSY